MASPLFGSESWNQQYNSEASRIKAADQAVRDKYAAMGVTLPPVYTFGDAINFGRFPKQPSAAEIAGRKELQKVYNVPESFEGTVFDFGTGKEWNYVDIIPEAQRKNFLKNGQKIPYTDVKFTGQEFFSPYSDTLSNYSSGTKEGQNAPTTPRPSIPSGTQNNNANLDTFFSPATATPNFFSSGSKKPPIPESANIWPQLNKTQQTTPPTPSVTTTPTTATAPNISTPTTAVNDAITAIKNATAGNNSVPNQNITGLPTIPKGITMGGGIGGVSNKSYDVWDYLKNFEMPSTFEPPNTDAPKVGWGI